MRLFGNLFFRNKDIKKVEEKGNIRLQYESEQRFMKESILTPGNMRDNYEERLRDLLSDNYQAKSLISNLFSKASNKKIEIISQLEELKNFYLVQTILSLFVEDAFAPSIHDSDILDVTTADKKLKKDIDSLDELVGFDQFIVDIAYDFMLYGDFCLETEVKEGEGIISLNDNVWQQGIVPVTKFGKVIGFLVLNSTGGVEFREPSEYIRFSLGPYGTRIDLYEEYENILYNMNVLKDLPRYVKIGRSLIFPVMDKLKELELLESLVPATKLAKLASGSLVGVQVPTSMDPDNAFKTCRRIEDLINKKVSVDSHGKALSIENVLASAGKIKIVPIFGDKGTLSKLDYKMDEPDDLLSSIEDSRKAIMSAVGYPYELLFGSDNSEGKSELLKKYARYLMRLRNIQFAACEGLKDMIIIHLVNRGHSFNRGDIEVKFRQKLLEINNTETLEFMDITVSYLNNLHTFLNELIRNEEIDFDLNIEILKTFFNDNLSLTGLEEIINKVTLKTEEDNF